MSTISGTIVKVLRRPDGELTGLILEGGQEIRLVTGREYSAKFNMGVGSRVVIESIRRHSDSDGDYYEAWSVGSWDTHGAVATLVPHPQDQPGMPSDSTPDSGVSLASFVRSAKEQPRQREATQQAEPECSFGHGESNSALPRMTAFFPTHEVPHARLPHSLKQTRSDAAVYIGEAYDRIHRVQAVLAYLYIIKRRVPGIGQFLDEAKHTYEQSLSRLAAGYFLAAQEFAKASVSLSRVIEIIMARTLRSDSTIPSPVPPPPENPLNSADSAHIEEGLAEAESMLARIHWILMNGTLPLEDRTQARRIASWSEALCKQARRLYHGAALPDASELVQAALAGAFSAEHVCREWYIAGAASSPEQASKRLHPQ